MKRKPTTMDRRTFLKGLAIAAGSLSGHALVGGDRASPFRVGILKVESRLYRHLSDSLLTGFQAYLPAQAVGRQIEVVSVATRATAHRMVADLTRFLEQDRVDLLVGPVGPAATILLAPILERWRTPLIVAGAGADTVRPGERSPWIAHNTLNHWRGSWALGAWAAQHPGTRVAVVSSLYDSGFDHLYAFEAGVASSGGELVGTTISDALPGHHDLLPVLAALEAGRPDAIFVLHSDPFAHQLLAAIGKTPTLAKAAVMTTELSLLAAGSAAGTPLRLTAWSPRLEFEENRAFLARFGHHRGAVDSFTMLGYETAQLVGGLLAGIGDEVHRPGRFTYGLAQLTMAGPRGPLRFDANSHSFRAPSYLQDAGGGIATLATVADAVTEQDERIRALHAGPRSGWLSDYLFV